MPSLGVHLLRKEDTMGFVDWLKKGACCAGCGEITLAANASMTECCNTKLCDATCVGAWRAELYDKLQCPYCRRRFNKESKSFYAPGK